LLLARCWTGVWALLSGRKLPAAIPPVGQTLMRAIGWDRDEDEDYYEQLFASRLDEGCNDGLRPEIEQLLHEIRKHPFMTRL